LSEDKLPLGISMSFLGGYVKFYVKLKDFGLWLEMKHSRILRSGPEPLRKRRHMVASAHFS
jgi:hypothetical protein